MDVIQFFILPFGLLSAPALFFVQFHCFFVNDGLSFSFWILSLISVSISSFVQSYQNHYFFFSTDDSIPARFDKRTKSTTPFVTGCSSYTCRSGPSAFFFRVSILTLLESPRQNGHLPSSGTQSFSLKGSSTVTSAGEPFLPTV
jgi:hypothetical protein